MTFKPNNMPTLSPYLTVRNASDTLDFYEKAFEFKAKKDEVVKGDDGSIMHAAMTFGGAVIMFGPEGAYEMSHQAPKTSGVAPAVSLYIYCEDVDALYNQAIKNGAESLMEPQESFWGDRICKLADPDGHEFMFATLSH
jgi:uncharacterized glyoxalase superfamily protein PhnB